LKDLPLLDRVEEAEIVSPPDEMSSLVISEYNNVAMGQKRLNRVFGRHYANFSRVIGLTLRSASLRLANHKKPMV
jgi:hypothetical protein